VAEKIETHILCSITFLFSKNRVICKIKWKNIVEPEKPRMTTNWHMRISRWVPQATNTHTLILCSTYCFFSAILVARNTSFLRSYVYGMFSLHLTKYAFYCEGVQVMEYEVGWSYSRRGMIRTVYRML